MVKALQEVEDRPFDGSLIPHESEANLFDPNRKRKPPQSLAELITWNSKLYGLAHGARRAWERSQRLPR
jgi:hypothetical protein